MTIEFLICTIDAGIFKIPALLMPPMQGVSYLVSWQHSGKVGGQTLRQEQLAVPKEAHYRLPEILVSRPDVQVVELKGRGLSRNRNHALMHATGDWLIIADDDCSYTPDSIEAVKRAIALHPQAAIVQLQATDFAGKPLQHYSAVPYEYRNRPRNAYVASCELVLRRSADLPVFDERFGLGAYLGCGEEDLFVHQTSQRGGAVYYEPLRLVMTPAETTGTRFAELPGVQRAKGGVLALIHGPWGATLRCLKFASLYPGVSLRQRFSFFVQMLKGIRYVLVSRPLP